MIFLKLRADSFGECNISFGEIVSTLGYATAPANICQFRPRLMGYLKNLVGRGDPEYRAVDPATIISIECDTDKPTKSSMLCFRVEHNYLHSDSGRFVTMDGSTFRAIVETAKANKAKTADLFGFYLFMDSQMFAIAVDGTKKLRGCWKYSQDILDGYGFCQTTYLKYRRMLNAGGLLFYRQPSNKWRPTMFANEDSQLIWRELKERFE